jgi:S-adenosylmethionine:tRNA ribosyltransferase-isomerase
MPLPPYIKRNDDRFDTLDLERYQTVYARETGAVAAPTAGLHFTPAVLDGLRAAGVQTVQVTLHVGPGTFKPIKTDDVRLHDVGTERYHITAEAAEAINLALDEGRRVIAVGTTVVRTLEAAGADGRVRPGADETSILITPGYRFRTITGMLTNFHIPKSSLILLVSALVGRERILDAYRTAVSRGYRFYSYGDSMLIL